MLDALAGIIYEQSLPAAYYSSRDGELVRCFVIHSTVGVDSREYLQNGGGRGVSSHKLIQKFPRSDRGKTLDLDLKGTRFAKANTACIYSMVANAVGANHAGYSRIRIGNKLYGLDTPVNVNQISLSIELENFSDPAKGTSEGYSEAQLLACGYQLCLWRIEYGDLPIYRHQDIDASGKDYKSGKYDPVGLTLGTIISYRDRVQRMLDQASDLWSIWGTAFELHKEWGIPQAWYKRARELGACVSDELFLVANTSIQYFTNGFIVYYKPRNVARAFLYAEL